MTTPKTSAAAGNEDGFFPLLHDLERAHEVRLQIQSSSLDYEEAADDANYELHWSLRERIDAVPARSIEGLKVKARAAELALASDPDAECDGCNSFVSQSQSIIRDIHALSAHRI